MRLGDNHAAFAAVGKRRKNAERDGAVGFGKQANSTGKRQFQVRPQLVMTTCTRTSTKSFRDRHNARNALVSSLSSRSGLHRCPSLRNVSARRYASKRSSLLPADPYRLRSALTWRAEPRIRPSQSPSGPSTTGPSPRSIATPLALAALQPLDHVRDCRGIVREFETVNHLAVGVRPRTPHAPLTPSRSRRMPDLAHQQPPHLVDSRSPGEGVAAGRSLQGARSAWPYRQSQRRTVGPRRTPIGPRGQASPAVTRRHRVQHHHPLWVPARPWWISEHRTGLLGDL